MRYRKRMEWIRGIADDLNKKFICVDSNISEFLQQDFQATCTFRTLAVPLLLQKLFSKYLFASGHSFIEFGFNPKSSCYYDLLNVQCLSTESIQFYTDGGNVSRMDKVAFISNFEVTYKKLNVCARDVINCSRCEKCQRTMMELDKLGRLDKYDHVFDLDFFRKNKNKFYLTASKRRDHSDWKEIYLSLKSAG